MYRAFFKRFIDLFAGLVAFLILSPVFLLLTLLLSLSNNGSPFFTQLRPGKGCKPFKVIKFKTMNDKRDVAGNLLPDEDRLTGIGKFVRKTSLDEIPQLMNVIKGDMSLIGPRPLLTEYVPMYSDFQRRRHEVRPGITGWAQVNGRNAISWKERFDHDVWYVENISLGLDLKIILMTLWNVVTAKGISSKTSVTMEKFKGNEV